MPASKRRASLQPEMLPSSRKTSKKVEGFEEPERDAQDLKDEFAATKEASPNLQSEMKLAKECFEDQEDSAKFYNQEVERHEKFIFQQCNEIRHLKKLLETSSPSSTAARDYAEVLSFANDKLTNQVTFLKDRNAFLDSELMAARKVLERAVPGEAMLKREQARLLSEKKEMVEAMSAQMREKVAVEKERDELKKELRKKQQQLHKQVLCG